MGRIGIGIGGIPGIGSKTRKDTMRTKNPSDVKYAGRVPGVLTGAPPNSKCFSTVSSESRSAGLGQNKTGRTAREDGRRNLSPRLVLILITFLLLPSFCCVAQYPNARVTGPFITYSHETFILEESGETGLHIDGENWFAVINLKGFMDYDEPFVSPYQFLFQHNDGESIRLSIFAEKTEGVTDSESAIDHFAPEGQREQIGGKTVTVSRSRLTTSIHYYPYYSGYCFDFHFSTDGEDGLQKAVEIIDSIRFVEGSFSKAVVRKHVYTYDKRIQLFIPDTWEICFRSAAARKPSSIVLRPKTGNVFEMYVSLVASPNDSAKAIGKAKENAQRQMAGIAEMAIEEPTLQELKREDVTIYYYIAADRTYAPSKENEYPLLCQGHAAVNGSILHFTILYHEKGKEYSEKGLDMISKARILDLR